MANVKSVFDHEEFKPYRQRYTVRRERALRRRRYYDGSIYDDGQFKIAHKLYSQTKGLFALLARAVDLDVAFVPGMMDPWGLGEDVPQAVRAAQALLYEWSSWDVEGDDWLEDGATTGEAVIKVVPDEGERLVRLQRLKPEIALLLDKHWQRERGAYTPLGLIVDPEARDSHGEAYEYAEAITPAEVRTYRNGAPWGYDDNPDRYPNPLNFVPMVWAKNDSECRPTFAKAQPQLVSVNELASYLADIIGRHAEPQWAAKGVEEGEMVKSGENMWYLPAGADIEAILATIDIEGVLNFIREVKAETKANLPELAFDDLRAKDQIATETLEVQLVELDAKIWKMRRRYDSALVDAHRMAATAGAIYGIRELAPLLQMHSFDFRRPVRPVSRLEEIRQEEAELALEAQKSIYRGEGLTAAAAPPAEAVLA
ncbi:MAG: hypothetical protein WBO46_15010 [Caldilineaceae bacterium]